MSGTINFKVLANPPIRTLVAYDPGHDIAALRQKFADQGGILELGSNENCYGPSPTVKLGLQAELDGLFRYPDPTGKVLKQALSEKLELPLVCIALGNGSHELLMQLAQVFAGTGDEILVSQYCFAVYPIAAQAVGAQLKVQNAFGFQDLMPLGHDLNALLAGISAKTKLIYLANPNNPTGTWCSFSQVAEFLAAVPAHVLVVIDEAYIEYATDPEVQSVLALQPLFANLIVIRTFSKAYGLAGARIGYLLADARIVQLLEPIRESFNVNSIALRAAHLALLDQAHVTRVCTDNAIERDWLSSQLIAIGLQVLPSQTNFLLVYFGENTTVIEQNLFAHGVMIRPMAGYGLQNYLRITLSTRADNQRFVAVVQEIMTCR
jgi:histidinol-phosphate aminotransferase